jgi:aerobic-type carbon monoxide dehydrogenase small subunit (CoxS/CutS family)
MILSALALLAENPDPTRDEIARGLNGNICRCGAYTRIVAAVEKAAKVMKGGAK